MRITVAICDDLEEERLQMARLLKNYGRRKGVAWEIELLESGAAFLDLFRPGRWDIILMAIYSYNILVESKQIEVIKKQFT